jgi:hypothetical protein
MNKSSWHWVDSDSGGELICYLFPGNSCSIKLEQDKHLRRSLSFRRSVEISDDEHKYYMAIAYLKTCDKSREW